MKKQYLLHCFTVGLLLLINCFAGGYACRQLCTARSSPAFERLQSRFADRAGRLWFECEDLAAQVGYSLTSRFAALRDKLFRGSPAQPLEPPAADSLALT